MKIKNSDDIPGSRYSLENSATKGNIYFMLGVSLLGGALFTVGLFTSDFKSLDSFSESEIMMGIGLLCFCLFFPWFMHLHFVRHILASVTKLEAEIETLNMQLLENEEDGCD